MDKGTPIPDPIPGAVRNHFFNDLQGTDAKKNFHIAKSIKGKSA
jgi:hypothetical protein